MSGSTSSVRSGSSRRAMWIGGATTVTLVALAISAFAAFGPAGRNGKQDASPAMQQSADAYRRAMMAVESSQTDTALALLQTAVKLDPGNAQARDELDRLTKKTGNGDGGGTGSGPGEPTKTAPATATPAPEFLAPVTPMTRLLPVAAANFALGARDSAKDSAAVPGSPLEAGTEVTKVLWTVFDMGSPAKAQEFATKTGRASFSEDAATVPIDGASAYFGTDGTRFAYVVYTRGRFVFETVATAAGSDPLSAKGVAIGAAKAFPDKL